MIRIGIAALTVLLTACNTFYVDTADLLRDGNKENLKKLSMGMDKTAAMQTMGTEPSRGVFMWIDNPYRSETVTAKGGQSFDVLYYYTDMKQRDDKITDDELTPLVFKDGKLIGWGNDALKRIAQ